MASSLVLTGCRSTWQATTAAFREVGPAEGEILAAEDEMEQRHALARRRPGMRSPQDELESAGVEPKVAQAKLSKLRSGDQEEVGGEEQGAKLETAPLADSLLHRQMAAVEQLAQVRRRQGQPEHDPTEGEDAQPVVFRLNDETDEEPEQVYQSAASKEKQVSVAHHQTSIQRTQTSVDGVDADPTASGEVMPASAARRLAAETDLRAEEIVAEGSSLDWQAHVREAIQNLEAEIQDTTTPELRINMEKTLRLLELSVNDLEGAMIPVQGMGTDMQDYLRYSMQAWHDSTDPNGHPTARKRFTLALKSQRKALQHLAAASDLEVHNVAFCTDVESYGAVTKFEENVFRPDQPLLLYLEVDNFVSLPLPNANGYETHLKGTYEIVDSQGNRIEDQQLDADQYRCNNPRRDYFIVYRIWTPKSISPGSYQLKLTIEDLNGHKFGHSKIDFRVVE
ncbi:MAG: hypothetical protein KDB22_05340 [Planctomycetales bacterium]|nr:hypothetical protein [Planctomycetales bacterium]